MASQSISTDGYLPSATLPSAPASSHGASEKSSCCISGTGSAAFADDPVDDGGERSAAVVVVEASEPAEAEQQPVAAGSFLTTPAPLSGCAAAGAHDVAAWSLASTDGWSGGARWRPPRRSSGKLRRAASPRSRNAAAS
ncbi:unnamed protein product [Urochloa decumbens]|uniref:Uncharacterized protein n=1 Tax=Urochloa decumbens TaxID=240449 RepID=A0ABC8WW49_9POAL